MSDEDYRERMDFLNRVLELSEFFDRTVRTLSLGQRMRADLGAALLHNPKVLYLDEPTIGLDLVVKDNIRTAIREINEKYNTTVILTTHDIGDIEELCSRIIIIDAGRKIYDGSLEELKDTYGTRRKVTMEVCHPKALDDFPLARLLEVDDSTCSVDLDVSKKLLSVTFDKHQIQVSQVLTAVMKRTYVFMVYVTSSMVTISIADWVSDDVVKGTVAMNLIKPIDYRLSLIARATGNMVYRFVAPGLFIWIGLEIYRVRGLGMPVTGISNMVCYLISCVMSFLIYVLFDFCFGMIAFFTTYIFGLLLVKGALLGFLMGQLIPISFFPVAVQRVFDFLPFSSMVYTPVMIYLGKYDSAQLMFVMLRQAAWIVILYALGSLIWRQVTKRLVVLGG